MELLLKQPTSIEDFAAATARVLKKIFNRKAPRIAQRFAELGRPMGARTVRKMTETSADVKRRNPLEHAVILLGATRRESLAAFEHLWLFLESYAYFLRGKILIYITLEEQFADFRFRAASAERSYFKGDYKKLEQDLVSLDQSLKGLFAKLQLIV